MADLIVHAHCYQPPREEPWSDLVPVEPSAAPDHDWNERITRECYRPLSQARVLDSSGRIRRVHNAWAWLSFNVGPTLAQWFARHAPDVLDAMREGDRAALRRTGHGTAIAHPYHHVILPLASRRDKRTEVRWGMREFRRLFGREPYAMWLPETAVDEETLEVLAEEGIRGTILAPHQVESHDSQGRPVAWDRPDLDFRILVYDGAAAHDVAFGPLLDEVTPLTTRLTHPTEKALVALATDGETFGHHRRHGDLAIGALIDHLIAAPSMRMIGAEEALLTAVPELRTAIVAPSSWSCVHGVGRWQFDCGCRMDPNTSQQWRAPLRAGLEVVRAGVEAVVEREWPRGVGNRHELRDIAGPHLEGAGPLPPPVRLLLEAERHALAMFTSCGWFFDDLARIEPRVVLRHAARTLELLPPPDAVALEEALRTALAVAHSNDATAGSGVEIWERDILPGRRAIPAMVAGIAALREFAPHVDLSEGLPAHEWRYEGDVIVTIHRTTGRLRRWRAEPISLGAIPRRVHVREETEEGWTGIIPMEEVPAPLRDRLFALVFPVVHEAVLGTRQLDPVRCQGERSDTILHDIVTAAWNRVSDATSAPLLHAALDLWSLRARPLPDLLVSEAWLRLATWPATREREQLAERFGIVLPEA